MGDIHIAVWKGDIEEVEELLRQDPSSVSDKDDLGREPLHESALRNSEEITKLLLEHGANPNARDEHDRTPLIEAASTGSCEVIELLKDAGANLAAKDNQEGRTALLWAAYHLQPGAIRSLIAKGADKDATDEGGLNLLHLMAVSPGLEAQDETSGSSIYVEQLDSALEVIGETAMARMLAKPTSDGNGADYLLRKRGVSFVHGYTQIRGGKAVPIRAHFRRK